MERTHKWSTERQEQTRDILNDPDSMLVWGLLPNESGVLKKAVFDENGNTWTEEGNVRCEYCFLKLGNAIAHKWIIDLKSGGTETFKSIEDLINAGWALD